MSWSSLVAQMVKNLPAMWKVWVQFLCQEDSLEKEMEPIPVFLPGKSHRQRNLVGYSKWGHKRVRHDLVTKQQQDRPKNPK